MNKRKMRNWPEYKKILSNIKLDENGCWRWQMAITKTGYGHLYFRGRMTTVHRASWSAFVGDIPKGIHVLHKCDVRDCCNPLHLFLGTHQDNMTDMQKKKRYKSHVGEKNWNCKLTDDQVKEIRHRYASKQATQVQLAKEFGVYQGSISAICRGASRKGVSK